MSHNIKTELSRDLGLFQLTMMGLGMMIGAGVFLGIGKSIFNAGPGGVLLTFGLNGLIALFSAMSYAELSSAIPRAGGAYNFARFAFGNGTSFLAGWMEWFASSVAGSMYAITFSIYTVRYLDILQLLTWLPFPSEMLVKPMAVLIAMLFIFINYRGVSETGKIGALMTLGQTLFLVVIGIAGVVVCIQYPQRLKNLTPFLPYGWSKLLVTMGFTYVAFEGFEVIAQAGDEAKNPRKNLPRAMIYSVAIAALIYMLVSFASLVSVSAETIDLGPFNHVWEWIGSFQEKGFGEAISHLLPMGNFLLTLAVIFASTSALNATVFSATRASYAMGRDKMLPAIFSRISKKRKTPFGALLLTGVIVITVVCFLPTMDVASSASIMFLFLFLMVNICVIKIRLNMGEELQYGFVMPFFPFFPIAAILVQILLAIWLVHMSLIAWIIAPLWIVSGLLIFLFYASGKALPGEADIKVLEEYRAAPGPEKAIMLSLANPANAAHIAENARFLYENENIRIKLLHMTRLPDQIPLQDGEGITHEGQDAIAKAENVFKDDFPVTTTIRYCRNIARGIISTVREKKISTLLMGWHGQKRDSHYRLGHTLDQVLSRSPSEVMIFKNIKLRQFQKLCIMLFHDQNDRFVMETALKLINHQNGEIQLIHLSDGLAKNVEDLEMPQNIKITETYLRVNQGNAHRKIKDILEKSLTCDAALMGIEEPHFSRIIQASLSEKIAEKLEIPALLLKRNSRIRLLTKKWL